MTQLSADALQHLQQDTFSKYLLESQQLIESISHYLKGEIEVPKEMELGNGQRTIIYEWKKPEGFKAPINEEGQYYTINFISTLLDKTITSSNLDEEKVGDFTRENINQLTINYYLNYNKYGFKSISEMNSIISVILSLLFAQFSRAKDMDTLKQLYSQHSIVEQRLIDKSRNPRPEPSLGM